MARLVIVGQERRKISQFHGHSGYSAWSVNEPHGERHLLAMQAGSIHHWDCYCPACKEDCKWRTMTSMMMNSIFGKMAVRGKRFAAAEKGCPTCEEVERVL